MRITGIRTGTVPLRSDIRNAYVDFREMTAGVVAIFTDTVVDGEPVIGLGFSSNGRYSPACLLKERFVPRLMAVAHDSYQDDSGLIDPERVWDLAMTGEKPGGHGERAAAIGMLDMALWDALAKAHGTPLYRLLADRFREGQADRDVFVYAAGGYYGPGATCQSLIKEVRSYLDQGYTVAKIKVAGASLEEDLRRIDAALEVLGSGPCLAVDANGRFDESHAIAFGRAIEPLGLLWYEEPGDPLDYRLHARLTQSYAGPLATGENLFSMSDARNLIRYAGMRPDRDVIQVDPALSYGLVEYLRLLAMLRDHGWSGRRCIPHGGHQLTLHIAAGLGLMGNEAYPGVFEPFGGFADDVPVRDGRITLPDVPGIGIELKRDLMAVFTRVLEL